MPRGRDDGQGWMYALGAGAAAAALAVIFTIGGGWNELVYLAGMGQPISGPEQVMPDAGDKRKIPLGPKLDDMNHGLDPNTLKPGEDARRPLLGQTAPKPVPAQPGSPEPDPVVESYRTALADMQGIQTGTPHPQGYRRTLFGQGWSGAKPACGKATTRDAILARDMKDVNRNRDCQVTSGTLEDPYTGRTIRFTRGPGDNQSSAVQIDHVVAVKDAWQSGAWQWTDAQRQAYYNDPLVLLAVDGPTNEAKGDGLKTSGASPVWMPPKRDSRCRYTAMRAQIKHRYGLTMTAGEKTQTSEVLQQCAATK
jgi:hypothetical protein